VATGQIYEPGEPSYDGFFKSLYEMQLTLGHAPDREQAVRQNLAKVADALPTATTDELSSAVDKKLDALSKSGVAIKVSATDLDKDTPSAHLVTLGTVASADSEAVATLDQSIKDAVSLLTDLRHAQPELAKLDDGIGPLETKVDDAFHDRRSSTKTEVRQNLTDAKALIPLMKTRRDEVDLHMVELLRALQKASPPAVAAPPAPAPAPEQPVVKKKKDKKAATAEPKPKPATEDAKPVKPKAPSETAPKAEPKPAKPVESEKPAQAPEPPKPAKPKPAEDFEP